MKEFKWVGTQPKFEIGSKVQLNAGGPVMSVYSVGRNIISLNETEFTGSYECQWFAGKKLERVLSVNPL